jgi:hypothetical protein
MKNIIIIVLLAILVCREYTRQDDIDWAIQNTSDELLEYCESRIDELTIKD